MLDYSEEVFCLAPSRVCFNRIGKFDMSGISHVTESMEVRNFFFLVGYVEERPWWPIQSSKKGRKKKVSS